MSADFSRFVLISIRQSQILYLQKYFGSKCMEHLLSVQNDCRNQVFFFGLSWEELSKPDYHFDYGFNRECGQRQSETMDQRKYTTNQSCRHYNAVCLPSGGISGWLNVCSHLPISACILLPFCQDSDLFPKQYSLLVTASFAVLAPC